MLEAILVGAVRGGTSMLFATVGETISERSGVINLGVEGSMLAGALAAYAVGVETGSPWLGVLGGLVAGVALSLVHAFMVLRRRANQIATGLAVGLVMASLASLFGERGIPFEVEQTSAQDGSLPVLTALACPYPDLAEADRGVCSMERMLISELIGENMRLGSCRLDGASCCTFEVTSN